MSENYYGRRLTVTVKGGRLVIEIGVDVLAHATSFADWANPFDEVQNDYIRTFAILNATEFANDVKHAMLDEREDGSSLLTDFLDKASQAAVDDGSTACDEASIKHGETDSREEAWALVR